MNSAKILFAAMLCIVGMLPAMADEATDAKQALERMVVAINEKSFESIKAVIDRTELTKRIFAVRPSEPNSRQALENQYWEMVEHFFWAGMPVAHRDHKLKSVHFRFQNGTGFAVLRRRQPGYSFAYARLDLMADSRGRLKIVDVQPFNARPAMSVDLADYMATFQPTRATTRALMKANELSDAEVFQVSELLKAYRDRDSARYFKIFDGLDKRLQDDELLARFNLLLAMRSNDMKRGADFLMSYVQLQQEKAPFSVPLAETYILMGDLEKGYQALLQFQQHYKLDEGAAPARLSALALALGDLESAETHALEAVKLEPTLELGWWSLLRARAAAQSYPPAIEALARLEDDFGHNLNAAKLNRDPYRAFGGLVESQAFKDWRASRE